MHFFSHTNFTPVRLKGQYTIHAYAQCSIAGIQTISGQSESGHRRYLVSQNLDKIGLGLRFESGLGSVLVLGLGLVFGLRLGLGLGLVITVQTMTVQNLTVQISTGNPIASLL